MAGYFRDTILQLAYLVFCYIYYEVKIKFLIHYRLESEDAERSRKLRSLVFILFALMTVAANIGYRLIWYTPNENLWDFVFDLSVVQIPFIIVFVIFTVALVQIRKMSV